MLSAWHGYSGSQVIHEVFRARVLAGPDATALVQGDRRVSYRALDGAADTVAAGLAAAGVRAGQHVPVRWHRSPELVAVILGILKVGASYAALDVDWPEARIRGLVRRLEAPLLITPVRRRYAGIGCWQPPGSGLDDWVAQGAGAPRVEVTGADPATVFFTSGSTGEPKAVISPHRATVRLFGDCSFARFDHTTVMPQAAPVSWDGFTLELWSVLLGGGTSVLIDEPYLDPQTLRTVVARHGVNTAWLSASLFNMVVEEDLPAFRGLRQVMIGGERVSPTHAHRFLTRYPDVELLNGYGPVETTVFATTHRIRVEDCGAGGIPIGRPVNNTEVVVLDRDRPCPDGETGEICVGGDGLAVGYLADEAETRARFVSVPLGEGERRVYRTGDLGHVSGDGLLHYDGRRDRQVKVRGHRIEPEEVEQAVVRLRHVASCAVVPRLDEMGACTGLVAYYTTVDGLPRTESALRDELRVSMPDHLVPDRLRHTPELPLLPNGKLDRQALSRLLPPAPALGAEATDPPADAELAAVTDVFAAVLALPTVAPDASYTDLGGTSLDAARICARLRERLGIPVPTSRILRERTPRLLSRWLAGQATEQQVEPPADPALADGPTPLSPAQVGFLLAGAFDDDLAAHCPMAWWVSGVLDEAALHAAVQDVHRRHQALHARYVLADPPHAQIAEPVPDVAFSTLPPAADEATAVRVAMDELMRPLAPAAGEVWRAVLVRNRATARTLFAIVVHHIAFDGASESLLAADLSAAYEARRIGAAARFERSAPTLRQVHLAQRTLTARADLDDQRRYWRDALTGIKSLPFPGPGDVPAEPVVAAVDVDLSAADMNGCDGLAARLGCTRLVPMLAAFAAAVGEVTGADDFGVGVPVAQRADAVLARAVGCLIDTVCVRLRPRAGTDPESSVAATGAALAAMDIPFREVVSLLKPPRDDRHPLYQTVFVLQDNPAPLLRLGSLSTELVRLDPPRIPVELACEVWPRAEGGAQVHLIHRTDRVPAATVAAIADAFTARFKHFRTASVGGRREM